MPGGPATKTTGLLFLLTGLIISLVFNFYLLSKSGSDNEQPPQPVDPWINGGPGYGINEINDQQATEDVIAFRTLTSNDSAPISYGIYYTPQEIKQYLDSVYPKIVASEIRYFKEKSQDWSQYEWRVGCYWMLRRDRDGIAKTDFCFVPTLVNKKNKYDALDYFVTDSAFYDHQVDFTTGAQMRLTDTTKPKGPVYNTGTMFP
ncbi:MAG: hypothetical protein EOO05_13060 [Chitinophagaceae bacterium]|nr:MAG: hypothetical protein EOO05_13060 [Chitinophagaceae bacterium]